MDDNYLGTTQASANATLTNSFSHLINPLNPSDSPVLNLYTVPNTTLGTNAAGVHILMERNISGQTTNAANPLTADDYAQRQFLYPVPEPTVLSLLPIALLPLLHRRRRRTLDGSSSAAT